MSRHIVFAQLIDETTHMNDHTNGTLLVLFNGTEETTGHMVLSSEWNKSLWEDSHCSALGDDRNEGRNGSSKRRMDAMWGECVMLRAFPPTSGTALLLTGAPVRKHSFLNMSNNGATAPPLCLFFLSSGACVFCFFPVYPCVHLKQSRLLVYSACAAVMSGSIHFPLEQEMPSQDVCVSLCVYNQTNSVCIL